MTFDPTSEKKQDYWEAAIRLAELPAEDQAAVVDALWHLAGNSRASRSCRAEAEQKALALESLLSLKPSRRPVKGRGRKARKRYSGFTFPPEIVPWYGDSDLSIESEK